MTDVDIDHLRSWIGREETASEGLSPTLVKQFCTTLGAELAEGDIAPQVIHFCLTQPAAPMDALGRDGKPPRAGIPRAFAGWTKGNAQVRHQGCGDETRAQRAFVFRHRRT